MLRIRRAIGTYILILVYAHMSTITAHAETYYVSTTGNNSNPGTEGKPWRTIAKGMDMLNAGDTLYVRGGTYTEGLMRIKRSGTEASPIKVLSSPGESPRITCPNASQSQDQILIQHMNGYNLPMGWITIEGLEIDSCYSGIKFYNLHNSVIRRNWIHNCLHSGIYGNGTRLLFDRNIVNSNGSVKIGAHGFYMNGSHFTITNNLIYDNQAFGIQLNGSASSFYRSTAHAGPEYTHSYNWTIVNNTFAYQRTAAGIVVWGSTCNDTRIENNIFYENSSTRSASVAQGIHFTSTTCTGIQIRNNLAFASGSGGTTFLGSGAKEWVHYTQSGNIVNVSNPGFANAPATLPESPNFKLTEQSPAIDKGLPLTAAVIALDGTTRPQGRAYDIGAYEYSTNDDTQSPKAPVALQFQ